MYGMMDIDSHSTSMYTLPELPYAYTALEPYIDEMTMHVHHDKHHAAYVKNLNDALVGLDRLGNLTIEQLLQDLTTVPEEVRTKVKNNGGGHANHTLFWSVMAPNGSPGQALNQSSDIAKAIDATFGSFEKFQELFSAKAMNRFGSGWVWLVKDQGGIVIADTANQDSPITEGKIPFLTLDVWEHAYYLKYQNVRAEYIKNWWNVVNWGEVERRFQSK